MEVRFTVRTETGEVIPMPREIEIKHTGPNYDRVMPTIRELPKYTRGKLKAPISYREIPAKELYGHDKEGVEIVFSIEAYENLRASQFFTSAAYDDLASYDNYPLPFAPFIVLQVPSKELNTVSLFNLVERTLCQDIRSISSMSGLEEAKSLYHWLHHFRNACKKVKLSYEFWGYENERQTLFVQPEGLERKRICELDHAQIKLLGRKSTVLNMDRTIMGVIAKYERDEQHLTCEVA